MMPRPQVVLDEALLRRVHADPALPYYREKAEYIGCSVTTYKTAIYSLGLSSAHKCRTGVLNVPRGDYGPVCADRAQRLFQAVLLEMWRAALALVSDKITDFERAAARRWFGGPDFDLVCQLAGVDADLMLTRYRAARARMPAEPRMPNKRFGALERIAA